MKAIHDLLDTGIIVPPVNIQDINVCCSQLLQAGVDAGVHRLDVVTSVIDLVLDAFFAAYIVCRVLWMS
jgi:hypothetical protein